jgi:serine/threonine protein kinase
MSQRNLLMSIRDTCPASALMKIHGIALAVILWVRRSSSGRYSGLKPNLIELITGLLTPDPSKRMTIREIFRHPWMRRQVNANAALR